MKIELGQWGRDKVTGFKGCACGIVRYLSGCEQILLVPACGADGKLPDGQWFDVQRVEPTIELPPVVLDNSANPGSFTPPQGSGGLRRS